MTSAAVARPRRLVGPTPEELGGDADRGQRVAQLVPEHRQELVLGAVRAFGGGARRLLAAQEVLALGLDARALGLRGRQGVGHVLDLADVGVGRRQPLAPAHAQGRIARQLYGEASQPAQLLPMLQQLLAGQPLPPPTAVEVLVDKVLLLCSVYDPETGTYRVDYRLVWELAGGITFVLALLLYLLNEWRLRRAMRRAALQA